ncbi:hypothetical protein NDU88_006219 [Pleurodeles waltl]|uniref:Uncharacterized protein n=1 Tax=Pleurodeles waltl TaxID=8319 RepID=A0AAV7SNX2_PLEWA|nr:hypothetical protein NDU88_006219 [Pleurodeles waltl]
MAASGVVLSLVQAPHRECSCFDSVLDLGPGRRVFLCWGGEVGRHQQRIAASPPGRPIFGPNRPRGGAPLIRAAPTAPATAGGTPPRRPPAAHRAQSNQPGPASPRHRSPGCDRTAAGPRGEGRTSNARPGGTRSRSEPPGVRTSGRTGASRRKARCTTGPRPQTHPVLLFRARATAEVARTVIKSAGLTPVVVGEPQLYKAIQGPG